MKLYIAGPMSGLPDFNYPAFFAARDRLAAAGYEPVNPARDWDGPASPKWTDYMRRGIRDVTTADGLAMLPGWQRSVGATEERRIAEMLGIPVKSLDEWLDAASSRKGRAS